MDYTQLAELYEKAIQHGKQCTCKDCRKFIQGYLKAMDHLRGEVIWETLSLTQKSALADGVHLGIHIPIAKHWSELSPDQRVALLKIDWEFTLGRRFPQLNPEKKG